MNDGHAELRAQSIFHRPQTVLFFLFFADFVPLLNSPSLLEHLFRSSWAVGDQQSAKNRARLYGQNSALSLVSNFRWRSVGSGYVLVAL